MLEKALSWLNRHCECIDVRLPNHHLVAKLYRLVRPYSPDVWFCMEMRTFWEPARLKRVCNY